VLDLTCYFEALVIVEAPHAQVDGIADTAMVGGVVPAASVVDAVSRVAF
jgi:hypothetical protein